MKRRPKRLFKAAVLAFAIAAVTASTAQAKPIPAPAASSYTPQQLRALDVRSQGMNQRYLPAASLYAPQQLKALQLRSEGMNQRYISTAATVQPSTATTVASTNDGFNWGDAFVGAAATFGMAIVLVAAFTAVRRREHALGV
jgi:hypothetical protein